MAELQRYIGCLFRPPHRQTPFGKIINNIIIINRLPTSINRTWFTPCDLIYLLGRCRSESALSSIQSHKALYLFPVTCLSKGTYCPLLLDSEMVRLEHFVLLFAILALCSATRTSYDGFQVIRVPTGEDSQAVDGIISQFNLDTWRYTWSSADVLIPPHHIAAFTEKMQEAGLNTTILDQDVGASIDAEGPIAATSK